MELFQLMNDRKWIKDTVPCSNIPFQTYECCYHIVLPWKCKFPWEEDSDKEITSYKQTLYEYVYSMYPAT